MKAIKTASTIALLSSLQVVANPRRSNAAKEVAFTHLTAQFKATLPKEFAALAAGEGSTVGPKSPTLNDLIGALGVVADPAALPSHKAKAVEKLVAYFKSLKSLPSKGELAEQLSSAIKKLETKIARAESVAAARGKSEAASVARSARVGSALPYRDGTIDMIERAARNTLTGVRKRG